MRIIQIKLAIMALITLFMYNQCGNPYQSRPTELQFSDQNVGGSALNTSGSVQAFADSVYQITSSRCVACHTTQNPTHAHPDVQKAHDIVVAQFKVNFSNIPNSRLVAKIRDENHGCWSDCTADSSEMQAAVEYWAQKVAEIDIEKNNNDGNTTGTNGGNTTGGSGYTQTVNSKDVFETTVWPISRQRCVSCHINTSPRHASDNVTTAYNAVMDNFMVNFDNIDDSRFITRLIQDNHHCWNNNCVASANEYKAAIQSWKNQMDASNNQNTGNSDPMTTSELGPVQTLINGGGANNTNIFVSMGNGNVVSPFVYTGGNDGYLWAPSGTGNNFDSAATNVGEATYTFNVPSTGTYKMSGMVQAIPNSDDSFFIKVDNENYFDWHVPESSFTMKEISTGSNRANKTWSLAAGNHTLKIKQREDGTKIKYINVYPSSQSGSGLGQGEVLLSYNVAQILGVNEQIIFQIKMKIFDDYSYKFWDPQLITQSSQVRVKDIKLLINGYYNPQHSAYTIVDKTVKPGESNLATHSLLALKDQGEQIDKISFKFEILEISN